MIPALWWSMITAAFGLQDVPVPHHGAAHETFGRLVQGDVCAHENGTDG